MKYSGATIGSKYLGSDMSVDMIMKEVELLRPLSPLMDVAVRVAGKKERKRKIKTEESSTSKKEKKKAKKENNRATDGNQADVASGSGDAQPSNSSHSFNTGQHFKIFWVLTLPIQYLQVGILILPSIPDLYISPYFASQHTQDVQTISICHCGTKGGIQFNFR